MDLSAIALQALQQADVNLDQAAIGIADSGGTSAGGTTPDSVDLSSEVVALLSAKKAFSANLSVLKTADEIQKSVIDIVA